MLYEVITHDIDSLQKAYGIDTVLFDKTGTLSEGRPFVTSVEALDGDVTRLLTLAASAQQGSEHPLGRAILAHAENYGIVPESLKSFEAIPGRGVITSYSIHYTKLYETSSTAARFR